MEKIEVLNGELQRLAKQIEEKRTEMIVAKLKEIQENGISEISELTEEENELLNTFLIQRGNPKSVMVQEAWHHSYWPEDSEYDYDITNCYLMIGDKIYSTRNNEFIKKDRIKEDYQTIDYDNEESNQEYKDDDGRRTLIGSKEELSESLNIEQLFEDILLKNGIKTIENIEKEMLEVGQHIKNVRKEIIKVKLKYLQENGVSKESRLTREEQRLLSTFLKQRGDPKSVMVQNEWSHAYYPEDRGYDYESTYCYLVLGDKIYSTRDNKFVERNEIEEDFRTINDEEDDRDRDDDGRETLIGSKEGLTIPLNIEQLFDIEVEIDDEEYEYYEEDEIEQVLEDEEIDELRRKEFEESLLREDVVEYYLSQTPEELEYILGSKISRMVGFEQKNSHHCYDLWEHTLRTVEGIKIDGLTEEQYTKLRIAAFLHDIGKPDVAKFNEKTGQQVFYGHATNSANDAKFFLENFGYSQDEIEQIQFYIAHHDDFISYKSKLEPFMVNHEFIRGISPESVAEKMIENKFDFEKMGYNKDQIRVICYTLANGKKPEFLTKDGPIEIPVDMEEVKEKINSQKYNMPYDASVEDYKMLLKLCKADAGAQSEIAMQNGRQVGSKAEKLENMDNIESVVAQAYRNVTQIVNEISHLKEDRDIAEHDMKMEDLGTSLPIMENEDIAKKYEELLSERIEMLKAEDDGEKRDKKAWELNSHLIELVEGFAESSPELQERLMEEKQIAFREYYGDDKEEVVEFEDDDPEYIDALLEKEIKSKEARDAGFEINEYGEIIRPAKQPTTEELEKMSEEELQEMIEKNNRIIESNKTLKKSLIERILNQQKIISEQQQEIMKLNSQKKEL